MTVTDLARPSNGLATADDFSPRFVVSLSDLREQIRALDDFKRSIMQQGSDFDVIPGTQKPTLLKPGAEKLVSAFGHIPHFRTVKEIQDWEVGFFYYQVECSLVNRRTGVETANGLGSCNTKEGRYRWRSTGPTCAACGHELMRSKQGGGWFCWQKKGGCGANYSADQVTGTTGRVENDDPYTLDNTVLKMAQKRALVAAVLVGFSASAIFTQDVEDYIEAEVIEASASPAPAAARPAAPKAESKTETPRGRYTRLLAAAKALGLEVIELAEGSTVGQARTWCDITEQVIADELAARAAAQPAEPEAF